MRYEKIVNGDRRDKAWSAETERERERSGVGGK